MVHQGSINIEELVMVNKFCLSGLLVMYVISVPANDLVRRAVLDVMSSNNFSDSGALCAIEEYGLPQELLSEASFTNLVAVVRTEINRCPASFVGEFTNDVQRMVFIEAVIRCGQSTYTNAVVNWFGGSDVPTISPKIMEDFAVPARTSMEDYCIMHYNEVGVSNVWRNIKAGYLALGENDKAAGIEDVQSGKVKAMKLVLQGLEGQ